MLHAKWLLFYSWCIIKFSIYPNLRVIGRYFFFSESLVSPNYPYRPIYVFFFKGGGGARISFNCLFTVIFFINFTLWDIFLTEDPFPAAYIEFDCYKLHIRQVVDVYRFQ